MYKIAYKCKESVKKNARALCLAGIIAPALMSGGCESLNNKSLSGAILKANAPNAKTPQGAYAANVFGDMLIGQGNAEAGKSQQTVIVNGAVGVLPAGTSHPSWPHVVADGTGGWKPAPGYKWLTQEDGDTQVIKIK